MEHYKFSEDRIYNCDETRINTIVKPREVVSESGNKHAGRAKILE
jgi:hypothetical protein